MREQSQKTGVLTIPRVDLTSQRASRWLRLVHVPPEGPAWFSELLDLKPLQAPRSLNVTMWPGVRVAGRLSETVPRPIANGRVVARVISGSADARYDWGWELETTITRDGSFVIDSIPANETLQLLAFCDGWVSRSPTADELTDYAKARGFATTDPKILPHAHVRPQLFHTTAPALEPVVTMERTADCEVTVVDDNGHPVPEARVDFHPYQQWYQVADATRLGTGSDTLKALQAEFHPGKRPKSKPSQEGFTATTNGRGMAIVANLPIANLPDGPLSPNKVWFSVNHEKYEAPLADGLPLQIAELVPGRLARVMVRMTSLPAAAPPPEEPRPRDQQKPDIEFKVGMTEPQFLEIVKQQDLKTTKTVDGDKVRYHIALGDGHTLIVKFDKDGKCRGIQRVRGEDNSGAGRG